MTGSDLCENYQPELRQRIIDFAKACSADIEVQEDLIYTAWFAIDSIKEGDKDSMYYLSVATHAMMEKYEKYYMPPNERRIYTGQQIVIRNATKIKLRFFKKTRIEVKFER